jgi:hypothetical protein
LVPLLVAVVGAFLGMFLPMAVYELSRSNSFELHNVFWESIFGIGFYVAAFIFDSYLANRWVGLIGLLMWPLIAMTIIFFASRAVLHRSQPTRIIWICVFVLSLFICVGHDAENYLSIHGLPLYWNLCANWY